MSDNKILQTPPPADKMPELTGIPVACPVCDMAALLGLGSSVCESLPTPEDKKKCRSTIDGLEGGKNKPVDTLKTIIVEHGLEAVDGAVDRVNIMLQQATALAAEELKAKGLLNPDGTRKDGK